MAADTALPTPAQAIEAYGWVDGWVRAWWLPPAPEADPNRIPCAGASVTLRLGGRVLGRATSMIGDGADVHRAAAGAWREASGGLLVERDATAQERTEVLAHRVTIELELAGPVTIIDGATFERAAEPLAPGRTGVGIRVGDRTEAIFAGAQLGTGLSLARALQAAAGALDLPPVELEELRASHGAAAVRFDTIHLAQVEPGKGPTFLHRGGHVVPQSQISGAGLRAAAAAMAANLRSSMWTDQEPFGIRGDYRAVSGQYEPAIARPRSQALAALALVRFAESAGISQADRTDALTTAADLVADLAAVVPPEEDPHTDPVAAAMSSAACPMLLEAFPTADRAADIAALGARSLETITKIATQADTTSAPTAEESAVVAWALATCARRGGADAPSLRSASEALVRRLIREGGTEGMVSLMPWIAWAILELHPEGDIPAAVALRDVRALTWTHQIGEEYTATPDLDLEGGVVFSQAGGGAPTASTLRVVSAMARLMGDPRMTSDEELLVELARIRRSLRFVVQLMFRADEAYLARNPDRAIGGVRPALWEPTVSVDATSMALLTVCDALEAVAARSKPR